MKKRLLALAFLLPALSACSTLLGPHHEVRSGTSSSLVEFLYPEGHVPPDVDDRVPSMHLPLRVGVAFVPGSSGNGPSKAEEARLLEEVAEAFRGRQYVDSIEAIPAHYLQRRMGMARMQQIADMFDLDVIALVSYNQRRFSSERDSSIFYWTIVGAAVVKGSSNEVQTLIDTAVFDVATTKLLFRAPGIHSERRNATLLSSALDARELGADGFRAANADMISNLSVELDRFEDRVKDGEAVAVINGGGGAVDWGLMLSLAAAVLVIRVRRGRFPLRDVVSGTRGRRYAGRFTGSPRDQLHRVVGYRHGRREGLLHGGV